jgi:hypothetical protein
MLDQHSGDQSARDPDRLIKWFVGVVVVGVGVELLSSFVLKQKWPGFRRRSSQRHCVSSYQGQAYCGGNVTAQRGGLGAWLCWRSPPI